MAELIYISRVSKWYKSTWLLYNFQCIHSIELFILFPIFLTYFKQCCSWQAAAGNNKHCHPDIQWSVCFHTLQGMKMLLRVWDRSKHFDQRVNSGFQLVPEYHNTQHTVQRELGHSSLADCQLCWNQQFVATLWVRSCIFHMFWPRKWMEWHRLQNSWYISKWVPLHYQDDTDYCHEIQLSRSSLILWKC